MSNFDFNNVEFENVRCLFCGEDDDQEVLYNAPDRINNLPGIFTLIKCKKCGLVFQNPRPREEFIKYYYPDETGYFQPTDIKKSNLNTWLEKQLLINYYNYKNLGKKNLIVKVMLFPIYFIFFRDKSIPKYIANGSLLDIGCSHGMKLEKLRKLGWQVAGIEQNKEAARYGIEKRGLDIRIGSINDFDFPENSFDAVIMDMVLEHLYHPKIMIEKISKWLKPNGQLFITIPYFEGIEFSIFKEYTYALQLPCHTYFFNEKNIKELLKDFYSINFVFQHMPREFVASANYKYQDTRKFRYKFLSNKIIKKIVVKPLVIILSFLHKTSRVTIKAIK